MKKVIFTLTAGAAALAANAAIAGDKKMSEAEYKAKAEAKIEETFLKVDANGDGSISAAEYMAHKTAEAEAEWAKWVEGDADGSITLAEAKATQAKMMAEKKAKKQAKMN